MKSQDGPPESVCVRSGPVKGLAGTEARVGLATASTGLGGTAQSHGTRDGVA